MCGAFGLQFPAAGMNATNLLIMASLLTVVGPLI